MGFHMADSPFWGERGLGEARSVFWGLGGDKEPRVDGPGITEPSKAEICQEWEKIRDEQLRNCVVWFEVMDRTDKHHVKYKDVAIKVDGDGYVTNEIVDVAPATDWWERPQEYRDLHRCSDGTREMQRVEGRRYRLMRIGVYVAKEQPRYQLPGEKHDEPFTTWDFEFARRRRAVKKAWEKYRTPAPEFEDIDAEDVDEDAAFESGEAFEE